MPVNLANYGTEIRKMVHNYESQINRLEAYNASFYKFDDGTTIEWTPEQKAKALTEAQADVTELETIVANMKTALNMT